MRLTYKASVAGFSLLECFASLTIIGVVAVFAVPNLQAFLQQRQASKLRADLTTSLTFASHFAQEAQQVVQMCFSQDNHCSRVETAQLTVRHASSVLAHLNITPPFRLHYRNFPFYSNTISFAPDRNDNATFWLCNAEQSTIIWGLSLSANGNVHTMHANRNGEFHASDGMRLAC